MSDATGTGSFCGALGAKCACPPPRGSLSARVRNLLRQVTNPDGKVVSYTYNALRLRSAMTDPDGGVTTYSYDHADRLETLTDPRGKTTEFVYDRLGRKIHTLLPNGATTTQVYNCADWLTSIEHRAEDGTLISQIDYTHDFVGNRTRADHAPSGEITTWTYDRTYQLTRERRSSTSSYDVTYTYDASGNRLTQNDGGQVTTYTYDPANQLTTEQKGSAVTTYTYDADGNRTAKETQAAHTDYHWDEDSRLVSAEPPAGVVTFTYYADGRRAQKETPSETRKFIYDGKKVLQETDGADAVEREYTGTVDEYGDLISEYDGSATSFHLFDGQHSTDALLDDSESVTDRYRHRAFGLEQSQSGTSETPFTFVGQQGYYRDPEIEFYFVSRRPLDYGTGQFASPDPLGFAAGDENLYRYVGNNPVNRTDPSGLDYVKIQNPFEPRSYWDVVFDKQPRRKDKADLIWGTTNGAYLLGTAFLQYSYDHADRLETLTDPRGKTTEFVYDALGRKIHTLLPNGATTTQVYNCADWLTSIVHRAEDGMLLSQIDYTHDFVGNRTRANHAPSGEITTWTYDRTYQLTRERRSSASSYDVTYTYDASGNRLTQNDSGQVTTYTYDAANQLQTEQNAAGVTTYTYDADGNRTAKETLAALTDYNWDEDSRLVSAEPPAGVVTFTYHADGRRAQKETPSETRKFIYDGKKVLPA
jgi:RHS repeat-associated protein